MMNKAYVVIQRSRFDSGYGEVVGVNSSKEVAEERAKKYLDDYRKKYDKYAAKVYFDIEEWEVDDE